MHAAGIDSGSRNPTQPTHAYATHVSTHTCATLPNTLLPNTLLLKTLFYTLLNTLLNTPLKTLLHTLLHTLLNTLLNTQQTLLSPRFATQHATQLHATRTHDISNTRTCTSRCRYFKPNRKLPITLHMLTSVVTIPAETDFETAYIRATIIAFLAFLRKPHITVTPNSRTPSSRTPCRKGLRRCVSLTTSPFCIFVSLLLLLLRKGGTTTLVRCRHVDMD